MRYLVVSDIHGSYDSAEHIKRLFEEEKCDKIICLGDVLYHGPRNDLPENYGPKKVIPILNELADKIICVKGNCDAEVDQMVLKFKIHDDYNLDFNNTHYYLVHGHHLSFDETDMMEKGSVVLYGHYHIPSKKIFNEVSYFNVGSITLPKENSPRSYGILDENGIVLKSLDGKIIM